MQTNSEHYGSSPRFRILSDKQIDELQSAVLQILERTGTAFDSEEAIDILRKGGADVSDPQKVKIPPRMVEQALKTAPKQITLYTREGEAAMVLGGQTGAHYGIVTGCPDFLDPYQKKPRLLQVADIAGMARLVDALPNIEWVYTSSAYRTLPGAVSDKVALLQAVLNTSKPVAACINGVDDLKEMIRICEMVAGGEDKLRAKPFFVGTSEPVTPLIQGKDAMQKSLLCAEKGIPNFVYSMPMSGMTTPATFAGTLAIACAEILGQLVVLQLKNPGAPIIFGSMPNIMDMKTTIYPYGAPELSLMVGALTELSHSYGLPILGTAGCTDSSTIDAQAASEVTYQCLISSLSGADFVHDVGLMYHATMESPEMVVFVNEVIDMVKVIMKGIPVNSETLPLDLIERKGPRSSYLAEPHTMKHFREFWVPTLFDRSMVKKAETKTSGTLLNEKTIKIWESHQPKPLPEELVRDLKKVEKTWFDRLGLKREYPDVGKSR